MIDAINGLLSILLLLVPFLGLGVYAHRHNLRISIARTCAILGFVLLVHVFVVSVFLGDVPQWQRWRAPYSTPLLLVYVVASIMMLRNLQWSKVLFVVLVLKIYADMTSSFAHFIDVSLPQQHLVPMLTNLNLAQLVIMIVTMPLALYLTRKIIWPVTQSTNRAWRYIWLVPLAFTLIYYTYAFGEANKYTSWRYLVFNIAFLSGFFLTQYIVVLMLRQTEENTILQEGAKATQLQVLTLTSMYDRLFEHIDQTKKAEHDLRHHLTAIRGMALQNETRSLLAYLNTLLGGMSSLSNILYCKHLALNALLNYYAGRCHEQGISFKLTVDLPESIGIEDAMLCVVFGNLIENAVHACASIETESRYIHLRAGLRGGQLVLTVDNSYQGTLISDGHLFLSHKRQDQQRGIGLTSVASVAEQYGGVAKFDAMDKEFRASVIMAIKPEKPSDAHSASFTA